MVKSSTQKKSNKLPTHIAKEANLVTDYLKYWTTRELNSLNSARTPICRQTNNGYKIGLYRLDVFPNGTCTLYNAFDEIVHTFETKISAVLYTIYTIKNSFSTASEILQLDKEINKNYTDMLTLRGMIDSAVRRKDYESVDIRSARLEIAQTKLSFARDKIVRLHNHAKYHKVWE